MSFLQYLKGTKEEDIQKATTNYDRLIQKKQGKLHLKEGSAEISVTMPKTFADIERLIIKLRDNQGAIVDLREAPVLQGQRFLDYLSGAVFGLGGTVERLENKMFLLTTKGVSVIVNDKEVLKCKRKYQKSS